MKVLHMISTVNDNGGIQKVLYSYISALQNMDISNSIVAHEGKDSLLAARFRNIGCEIKMINPRSKAGNKYYRELYKEIQNSNYDILHIHIGYKSVLPLLISKRCHPKAKVIVHIHSNRDTDSFITNLTKCLCVRVIKHKADAYFACGRDAAIWFYGKDFYDKKKVYIMKNALPTGKYNYSQEERNRLRNEFGVTTDTIVYGHVGTFYEPKNQLFIIDIFRELCKSTKAVLVMVGAGKLEKQLKEKVSSLGLTKRVIFTGVRDDVPSLLSSFDAFLLPSLYEGFPMSLLEAQCSGLYCFTSNNVTDEVNVSGNVYYQDLSKNAVEWAEWIVSILKSKESIDRENAYHIIENNGYLIEDSAKNLYEKYQSIFEG